MARIRQLAQLALVCTALFGCAVAPRYYGSHEPVVSTEPFTSDEVGGEKYKVVITGRHPALFESKPGGRPAPQGVGAAVTVSAGQAQGGGQGPANLFLAASAEGQKALIEYLKTKDPQQDLKLLEGLFRTLRTERAESVPGLILDLNPSVQLTISSALYSLTPADRLEKVYTYLILPYGNARILALNHLETERGRVEFGTLVTAAQITGQAGIAGIPIPQAGGTGTASISPSYIRQLTRVIAKEFARRNFEVSPDRDLILITQDGEAGADISGNVLATITLEVATDPSIKLDVFDFTMNERGEPIQLHHETLDKLKNSEVKGKVAWIAVVRSVSKGGETVLEDDDHVTPIVFKGVQDLILWRNPTRLYYLFLAYPYQGTVRETRLSFTEVGRAPSQMVFKSLEEAHRFRTYLMSLYERKKDSLTPMSGLNVERTPIWVGFPVSPVGETKAEDENRLNFLRNGEKGINLLEPEKLRIGVLDPTFGEIGVPICDACEGCQGPNHAGV